MRRSHLDHDVVLVDLTVVGEAAQRGDRLLRQIRRRRRVVVGLAVRGARGSAQAVDLLVDLCAGVIVLVVARNDRAQGSRGLTSAVVVAALTGASDSPRNTGRVPGTNASHLAVTTVSLALQAAGAETVDDTLDTLTLGDTNDVDLRNERAQQCNQ